MKGLKAEDRRTVLIATHHHPYERAPVVSERRLLAARRQRGSAGMLEVLIVTPLVWGVLAFGAVYPWAYWPLLAAAATVGMWGTTTRRSSTDPALKRLAVALAAIAAALALQLVPLPARLLAALSPATDRLLRTYDLGYAVTEGAHPLSITPASTFLALTCFVVFSTFCIGCAMRLTTRRATAVARAVTVLAVVIAVIGIVEKASGTQLIYGFWRPFHDRYQIFGPFVNKNHYAGWMIMALSLTVGSIGSGFADSIRRIKPGWRNRVLWISTPAATYIMLAAVGTLIMITALLMTMSRSGIVSWTAAAIAGGAFLVRRSTLSRMTLGAVTVYTIVTVLLAAGWTRPDVIAERFRVGSIISLEGRLSTWIDALHIARDFQATGTGVNTFGTAMIFYQSQSGAHWDTAHNDYLQLVAEGGVLLTVPIAVALILFVRQVRDRLRADRENATALWLRLGAVVGLLAIALQELVDFSLQIPGNAILLAVLAAIALHTSDSDIHE